MVNTPNFSKEKIFDIIKENNTQYFDLLFDSQFSLLNSLYKSYKNLESGSLVLYVSKKTQQSILRKRENNLESNISLANFWYNNNTTKNIYSSFNDISIELGLPKETIRRKVISLIRLKVLKKSKKNIFLSPNVYFQNHYSDHVILEINKTSTIINYIANKLNISFTSDELNLEIKKNFSFYWFHYLKAEINFLKTWNKKLKDLEFLMIILHCKKISVKRSKNSQQTLINEKFDLTKTKNVNLEINPSIISTLTGIPRANCIRKINKLVKMKLIQKDKNKIYVESEITFLIDKIFNRDKDKDNLTHIFCNFYFLILSHFMNK